MFEIFKYDNYKSKSVKKSRHTRYKVLAKFLRLAI